MAHGVLRGGNVKMGTGFFPMTGYWLQTQTGLQSNFESQMLVQSALCCLSAQGRIRFIAHRDKVHISSTVRDRPLLTVRMEPGGSSFRAVLLFKVFIVVSCQGVRMRECWVNGAQLLSLLKSDTWNWWLNITRSVPSGTEKPIFWRWKDYGYLMNYKIKCLPKMSFSLFSNVDLLMFICDDAVCNDHLAAPTIHSVSAVLMKEQVVLIHF